MIKVNIISKVDNFSFDSKEIEDTLISSLKNIYPKNNLEIEVMFVGPSEIKDLNKAHRSIDKPTDVLSFPQTQFENNKINILGSIVICPSIAEERDEPARELLKHGLLHLLGYDHETDLESWDKAAKKINCNF